MASGLASTPVEIPAITLSAGALNVDGRSAHVVVSVTSGLPRPLEMVSVRCIFFDRQRETVGTGMGGVAYLHTGQIGYTIVGVQLDGRTPVAVQCGVKASGDVRP